MIGRDLLIRRSRRRRSPPPRPPPGGPPAGKPVCEVDPVPSRHRKHDLVGRAQAADDLGGAVAFETRDNGDRDVLTVSPYRHGRTSARCPYCRARQVENVVGLGDDHVDVGAHARLHLRGRAVQHEGHVVGDDVAGDGREGVDREDVGGELLVRKCVHCHGRGLAGPDLGGVDLAEAGHHLELGEVDEREQRRRSCSSRGGAGGAGRRCSAAADGLANGGTDRGDRPVGGCQQRRLLERKLGSRERCLGGRDVRLGGCEVALGGRLALDRVRCDG